MSWEHHGYSLAGAFDEEQFGPDGMHMLELWQRCAAPLRTLDDTPKMWIPEWLDDLHTDICGYTPTDYEIQNVWLLPFFKLVCTHLEPLEAAYRLGGAGAVWDYLGEHARDLPTAK